MIELRFVRRKHYEADVVAPVVRRILQFRRLSYTGLCGPLDDILAHAAWSEWQDVPEVDLL